MLPPVRRKTHEAGPGLPSWRVVRRPSSVRANYTRAAPRLVDTRRSGCYAPARMRGAPAEAAAPGVGPPAPGDDARERGGAMEWPASLRRAGVGLLSILPAVGCAA